MSVKLRDLIRAVRACKTAAEERGVISTECALIRTAIKEEDEKFRHRNVAKLMYIHMLGYPTHFGQMECLKLISAPGFPDKRIGYLALTLLLTEQTEVLMLVTNSLKVDLTHANQFVQGLSLCVIGNMATPDMARDVASDVEKLLHTANPYLRKKAALATIRLLKKEPDLVEHLAESVLALLKDKAHGVLLAGLQLMIEILEIEPKRKAEYAKTVPALVRLLRSFISMGFSPEHDVGGITDPFVQVKLLNLLGRLGKDDEAASEAMNDVLAQVATNTDAGKNAGSAILYECVQTIMEVKSENSLRVLAVNILGRFLLNRDNNIRYVALNSLSKVVSEDVASVQRHRNTIVECLKDADVSIRSRALELIYQLVNDTNVVSLTTELLNYLVVASSDQKANLISRILLIVENFSPNKKWKIDTLCTMLSISGSEIDEAVCRTAICYIAQSDGFHGYAAHRLYQYLVESTEHLGVLQTGLWCLGEYGELAVQPCPSFNGDSAFGGPVGGYPGLGERDVLALIEKCMRVHNADANVKALGLNALAKLSVRYLSGESQQTIQRILKVYTSSMNLELQQRGTEYSALLNYSYNGIRSNLLGKMPIVNEATMRKKRMTDMNDGASGDKSNTSSGVRSNAAPMPTPAVGGTGLLDLDDIFGGAPVATRQLPNVQNQKPSMPVSSGGMDLLSDVFSTGVNISNNNMSAPALQSQGYANNSGLLDLMGGAPISTSMHMPPQAPAAQIMDMFGAGTAASVPATSIQAYDKDGLAVYMTLSKPEPGNPSVTKIVCRFDNANPVPLQGLVFQAAVPKYLKLTIQPPTSTVVPARSSGGVTQEILVTNSMQGEKSLLLKLKIGYSVNGSTMDEMATVSNFPVLY